MDLFAPLLVAIGGMPALGIAAWYARVDSPLSRIVALHWALIALCMFVGALGLYWAGGIEARIATVAIVMVAAVNVLALSMILRLRRGERRP